MSRYTSLEKLYAAVDEYCTASKEAKGPIPEHYWRKVVQLRNEIKAREISAHGAPSVTRVEKED